MILVKKDDIHHKLQLQKLLIAVVDDAYLSRNVYFKGGTCAEMSGFLDRFSVDLDFDYKKGVDAKLFRLRVDSIALKLELKNSNENLNSLFFNFKYKAPQNERNTLKLSFFENNVTSNDYEMRFLPEIDRTVGCQTIETMFANKLVSVTDRYDRHGEIAGRDIYDVHYFFSQGYGFKEEIIKERTGLNPKSYIKKLTDFIDEKVTEEVINQDLNTLLPFSKFNKIRKTLKQDTLLYLRNLI